MHEVLVNRLGGLSLLRKSVIRLTDHPDLTLDVYRGHKTTTQQQLIEIINITVNSLKVYPYLSPEAPKMKIVEILSSVELDEVAQNEPTHVDLHCLPFGQGCHLSSTSKFQDFSLIFS